MEGALSAFHAASSAFEVAASSVAECHQQLHKEVARSLAQLDEWKEWRKVMTEHAAVAKERVTLNVGGKVFCTSKTTLLAHEGTFFYHMISSGAWQPDEDGQYFIDRNPKQFGHILDFLRGQLEVDRLEEMPPSCLNQLKCEADFYQLEALKALLQAADWYLCPASVPPSPQVHPHLPPFTAPSQVFGFGGPASASATGGFFNSGPVFGSAQGGGPSASSSAGGFGGGGFSFGVSRGNSSESSVSLGLVASDKWPVGDPVFSNHNRIITAMRERQLHVAVGSAAFTSGAHHWELRMISFRDRSRVKVGVVCRRPLMSSALADQPDIGCTLMDLLGNVTKPPQPHAAPFAPLANSELQPGDTVGVLLRIDLPGGLQPTLSFEFRGTWSEAIPLPGTAPFSYYPVVQLGECPDCVHLLRFTAAAGKAP